MSKNNMYVSICKQLVFGGLCILGSAAIAAPSLPKPEAIGIKPNVEKRKEIKQEHKEKMHDRMEKLHEKKQERKEHRKEIKQELKEHNKGNKQSNQPKHQMMPSPAAQPNGLSKKVGR